MSKPIKRRFIAGAVCPECKLEDKVFTYRDGPDYIYECVNCGHSETMSETVDDAAKMPTSAVDVHSDAPQIVRLIDPN